MSPCRRNRARRPGTADHIKTGKLRALAVTTAARMPDLPEVPKARLAAIGGDPMPGLTGRFRQAGARWFAPAASSRSKASAAHGIHSAEDPVGKLCDASE
jgi:hypothetical protein